MKLKAIPKMASVMTPFPYSIESNDLLENALAIMQKHDIRHLPVIENGKPIGVVSEREIKLLLSHSKSKGKSDSQVVIKDAAPTKAYMVNIEEPLDIVLEHMISEHIGSAVVLKDGRLAGIFTAVDACRVLCDQLRAQFKPDVGPPSVA